MKNPNILISGAGIAGPALAFWLARHGFRPTIVEQAPGLRDGGYAVDFRGRVHLDLLARMGLLDEIRRQQTHMGAMSYVDAAGRVRSSLPADFMSGDVEILRGDLGRILFDATAQDAEYIFGDSIAALQQDERGVEVTFASGAPRRFDLVVGADGLHSGVRARAFCEAGALYEFGYHVAIFTTPNLLGLDRTGVFYNEPGLSAGMYAARDNTEAKAAFSFATPDLPPRRRGRAEQEAILRERFGGMKWETASILKAMPDAPDLYFDSVSQVRLDRWSASRVTLVGDAGYCPSPWSGAGTGLAVVGAYVLAGELRRAGGDHEAAFAAYERRMRPYVTRSQKMAEGAGDWVAPIQRWKLWRRDLLYRTLPMTPWNGMLADIPRKTAEAIVLEDY
ncbi:FAD-dependent monooxygenase [Phenylobacterium sp.]|uniref:FAD-dependent monooxygenase n=1 Tax=Phenylobacterium sp. TaxID=1871053 RepID=UPI002E37D01D|nr:FAD-dependent monooxygenase [Phenylobacterium sp.]HEX3365549.1 FAD-dependent monooxygenase [Phenylobacterium sp.]